VSDLPQLARAYDILLLLLSSTDGVSTDRLSELLSLSRFTVLRHLRAMRLAGIPVKVRTEGRQSMHWIDLQEFLAHIMQVQGRGT